MPDFAPTTVVPGGSIPAPVLAGRSTSARQGTSRDPRSFADTMASAAAAIDGRDDREPHTTGAGGRDAAAPAEPDASTDTAVPPASAWHSHKDAVQSGSAPAWTAASQSAATSANGKPKAADSSDVGKTPGKTKASVIDFLGIAIPVTQPVTAAAVPPSPQTGGTADAQQPTTSAPAASVSSDASATSKTAAAVTPPAPPAPAVPSVPAPAPASTASATVAAPKAPVANAAPAGVPIAAAPTANGAKQPSAAPAKTGTQPAAPAAAPATAPAVQPTAGAVVATAVAPASSNQKTDSNAAASGNAIAAPAAAPAPAAARADVPAAAVSDASKAVTPAPVAPPPAADAATTDRPAADTQDAPRPAVAASSVDTAVKPAASTAESSVAFGFGGSLAGDKSGGSALLAGTGSAFSSALASASASGSAETLPGGTVNQIVQAIRLQWANGGGEAHIRLEPGQFGDVTVSVRVDRDGQVIARVEAGAPVVREWLESNQSTLRHGLAEQNLTLDRLEVAEPPASRDADRRGGRPSTGDQPPPRRQRQATDEDAFEVVA